MKLDLNSVSTRDAHADDVPYLNNLLREVINIYVEQTWSNPKDLETFYIKNTLHYDGVLIFQKDKKDIGFVRLEQRHDTIFLDQLHLAPAYQRQGIGSEIISAVQAFATTKGQPISLVALRVNPACRLYEHLGFVKKRENDARYCMEWRP